MLNLFAWYRDMISTRWCSSLSSTHAAILHMLYVVDDWWKKYYREDTRVTGSESIWISFIGYQQNLTSSNPIHVIVNLLKTVTKYQKSILPWIKMIQISIVYKNILMNSILRRIRIIKVYRVEWSFACILNQKNCRL